MSNGWTRIGRSLLFFLIALNKHSYAPLSAPSTVTIGFCGILGTKLVAFYTQKWKIAVAIVRQICVSPERNSPVEVGRQELYESALTAPFLVIEAFANFEVNSEECRSPCEAESIP
jgi:hypothetical protein